MFRSKKATIRFDVLSALVLAAALIGAVMFFNSSRQGTVPVTGAEKAVSSAASAPLARSEDLGAGYRLVTDSQGTRIVAPAVMLKPADKTYDLGAGYRLVITASSGEIIPPERPSTDVKRVDLGAGYWLETTRDSGRIVAPSSSVKPAAQAVREEYIGGGYWLITSPDGGMVVKK